MASLLDYVFRRRLTSLKLDIVIAQGVFNLFPFFPAEFYEPSFAKFIKQIEDESGYSGFKGFMNEANRSNGIFASTAVCQARLALSCMHLLGHSKILQTPDSARE
jgi:hypothetical protein